MSIQSTSGFNAYNNAMAAFQKSQRTFNTSLTTLAPEKSQARPSFSETLKDSLSEVQDLQEIKDDKTKRFASGETQNIHELMISIQKASTAVSLTAAVRNKALEAYRELSRIQF